MGRGSDRSLIGKVMTNYMECPMRGEGWSLEIDVPPHAMLIPVWDEWKISLESSRYMPAADQPGLAFAAKKGALKTFQNRKSPPGGLRVYRRSGYGDSLSPERKFTSVPRTTAWSGCWCRIFRPFPGNSPVSSDLPWWKISVNYQRI